MSGPRSSSHARDPPCGVTCHGRRPSRLACSHFCDACDACTHMDVIICACVPESASARGGSHARAVMNGGRSVRERDATTSPAPPSHGAHLLRPGCPRVPSSRTEIPGVPGSDGAGGACVPVPWRGTVGRASQFSTDGRRCNRCCQKNRRASVFLSFDADEAVEVPPI